MAEWTLPTGEVLTVPDTLDEHEAVEIVEREFLSPEAGENTVMGALHRQEAARNPAYDPYDGTLKDSFSQNFAKYQNRERAVMAQAWGAENVDKWLEGGSRPEEVPEHVRKYTNAVVQASTKVEDVGALTRGFMSRFGGGNAIMLGQAIQAAGDMAGWDGLRNWGAGVSQWGRDNERPYELHEPTYKEVNGFWEGVTYVGESIGEFVGTLVPTAASAGLGATAGFFTPIPGGAAVGGLAGAASSSYIMSVGELRESAMSHPAVQEKLRNGELTHREISAGAALFGIPMAALDTMSLAKGVKPAFVKERINEALAKYIVKHAGTTATREGATEAAQEAINEAFKHGAGQTPWDAESMEALINAALKGGIGGKTMGLTTGSYRALRQKIEDKRNAKRLKQIEYIISLPDGPVTGPLRETDEDSQFWQDLEEWQAERGYVTEEEAPDVAESPVVEREAPSAAGSPTPATVDVDALRDANFTETEIRNPKNVDPRKMRQAKEGYHYVSGQWRRATQQDVDDYNEGAIAERKRMEQQLEQATERHGIWEGKIANVFGSDYPAITYDEAVQRVTGKMQNTMLAEKAARQVERAKAAARAPAAEERGLTPEQKKRARMDRKNERARAKRAEAKRLQNEAKALEATTPRSEEVPVDSELQEKVEKAQSVASDRTDSTPIVPVSAENSAKLQQIRRQQLAQEAKRQREEDNRIRQEAIAEAARARAEVKAAQEAAAQATIEAAQAKREAETTASKNVEAGYRLMLDDIANGNDSRFPDVVTLATVLQELGLPITLDNIAQVVEAAQRARRAATVLNGDIAPYMRREIERMAPEANKMLSDKSESVLDSLGYGGFYDPVLRAIAENPDEYKTMQGWLNLIDTVGGRGYVVLLEIMSGEGWTEQELDAQVHKLDVLQYVRENQVELVDYVSNKNAPESPNDMGRTYTIPGQDLVQDYVELHIAIPNYKGRAWQDGHGFIKKVKNPIARTRFHTMVDTEGDKVLVIDEFQPPKKTAFDRMPEYFQRRWESIALRRMMMYAENAGFKHVAWPDGDTIAKRWKHAVEPRSMTVATDPKTGAKQWFFKPAVIDFSYMPDGEVMTPQMMRNTSKKLFERVEKEGTVTTPPREFAVSSHKLNEVEGQTTYLNVEEADQLAFELGLPLGDEYFSVTAVFFDKTFPEEIQGTRIFLDTDAGGVLLEGDDINKLPSEIFTRMINQPFEKETPLVNSRVLQHMMNSDIVYKTLRFTEDEIDFDPDVLIRRTGWERQLYDNKLRKVAKAAAKDFGYPAPKTIKVHDPEIPGPHSPTITLHSIEIIPTDIVDVPMKSLARRPDTPITPVKTDTRVVTNPWDHLSELGQERQDHLDEALFETIKLMAARIAPGVTVKKANARVEEVHGTDWAGLQAGSTIWLALQRLPNKGRRTPAAVFTAYHEMIHYLDKQHGILNDAKGIVNLHMDEAVALVTEYYDNYLGYSPEGIARIVAEMRRDPAEALAYTGSVFMVQQLRADHNRLQRWPEPLRKIVTQLIKFLKRVKVALNQRGFQSLDQIFEEVRDGRRGAKLRPSQNPVAAQTATEAAQVMQMGDEAFVRWFQNSHMIDEMGRPKPGYTPTVVGEPSLEMQAGPLGAGVYMYDNPEDAARHAQETQAMIYLRDRMPEEMTEDERAAFRQHMQEGFSGPATFPALAAIKRPFYADRPIADEHRQWMIEELKPLTKVLSNAEDRGTVGDIINIINNAETYQDLIDSNLPFAIEFPLELARKLGRDGVRVEGAWIYTGGPKGIRDMQENWRPANKSLLDVGKGRLWNRTQPVYKYTAEAPKDLTMWGKILGEPRWQAKRSGYMAPVYMAASDQKRWAAHIIQDAALLSRKYMRLDKDQRHLVNRAMELARRTEQKMRVGTDGQIAVVNQGVNGIIVSDLNPAGTDVVRIADPAAVEAAMDMQKLGEKMWDYMRDAFMHDQAPTLGANGEAMPFNPEWTNEEVKQHRENLKEWEKTNRDAGLEKRADDFKAERERIADIYKALKELQGQRDRSTYVPLSRFGQHGVVIETYNQEKGRWEQVAFETFEEEWRGPFRRGKLNMAKVEARVDELLARYPGSRVKPPDGKGIAVYTVEPDGSRGEAVHWIKFQRGQDEASALANAQRQFPGLEVVREDRGENEIFELTRDNINRMAGNPMVALDLLVGQLSHANREKYLELQPILVDIVRKRGFGTHLKQARMFDGYSPDLERAWGRYLIGAAGFAARMKYGKTMTAALNAIPSRMPKLFQHAKEYTDSIMDPQEDLKRLRGLTFFWYLGGNISSAAIQLMNLPMYSLPHMGGLFGQSRASFVELNKAFVLASKIMAKQGWEKAFNYNEYKGEGVGDPHWNDEEMRNLFRDEQEFLAVRRAWREGFLAPMLMLQQVGHVVGDIPNVPGWGKHGDKNLGKMGAKAWMETQNFLSAPFGAMEKLGRMTQFIAAYRIAQNPAALAEAQKNLSGEHLFREMSAKDNADPAYNVAIYMLDDIMGQFDKTNRAPYERMGGGIALVAFQFQSWVRQILSTMVSNGLFRGRGGKKAALMMAGMLLLTSGYQGLPGEEDLEDVVEWFLKNVFGEDVDITQVVKDFGTEEIGLNDTVMETIMYGALRPLFEASVEKRIGLGRLPGSALIGTLFGDGDTYELLGPAGSTLFGSAQNFGRRRQAGESFTSAAGREFTPQFIKNAVNAGIWWGTGYKSQRGHMLVSADDLSGWHLMLKSMGFNPRPAATAQEMRQAERREAQDLGKTNAYRGRLVSIYTRMVEAQRRGDLEEVRDARKDADAVIEAIRRHNASAPVEDMIRVDMNGIQRSVMLNLNPHLRGVLGAPVHKRRRIMEMRQ